MYTVIVIIFSIIVIIQFLYIVRLRMAVKYAVQILKKYESALLMDDIIRKVSEENESKTSKVVSK